MTQFKFTGKKQMAVSLNPGGDFILVPGEVYELDETNPHVRTLAATGYLGKSKAKKSRETTPVTEQIHDNSTINTKTDKK